MFSFEFCKISRNTFLTEYLQNTASVATVMKACKFIKNTSKQVFSCEYSRIFAKPFFIEQLQWLLLNYILVSERIINKESLWIDLISLFNVQIQVSTSRSTTTRASVFLAKSAEIFLSQNIQNKLMTT